MRVDSPEVLWLEALHKLESDEPVTPIPAPLGCRINTEPFEPPPLRLWQKLLILTLAPVIGWLAGYGAWCLIVDFKTFIQGWLQ
jgi:hypothetical protein